MNKLTLGWQSWSPPQPKWYGLPLWDYSPYRQQDSIFNRSSPIISHNRLTYWCSWYALGKNISHTNLLTQAQLIREFKLPIEYILIDDGWCSWGDWDTPSNNRFPNFISTIQALKNLGFKVGLWFAPYLVDPHSNYAMEHPTNIQGIHLPFPTKQQLRLNNYSIAKDVHQRIIDAINLYNLDLVKLDFLYAPYFLSTFGLAKSHQLIQSLFSQIHSLQKNIITIACGAPFTDVIGQATLTRLSKDSSLPPPCPHFLRQYIYEQRMRLLRSKYKIWQQCPNFAFDPDVRLFSLDTTKTRQLWQEIQSPVKGIGDNFNDTNPEQIREIQSWLS